MAVDIVAGDKIASCVESFPTLGLDVSLHPITRGVVRIQLTITPEFVWKVRVQHTLTLLTQSQHCMSVCEPPSSLGRHTLQQVWSTS